MNNQEGIDSMRIISTENGTNELSLHSLGNCLRACHSNSFWKDMNLFLLLSSNGGCPHGVMVKAMECRIVVCEFVLQSCYYVLFRANTLGKGMNPLILPAMC